MRPGLHARAAPLCARGVERVPVSPPPRGRRVDGVEVGALLTGSHADVASMAWRWTPCSPAPARAGEAGRGCRQRGQHYAARFFDGYGWCDNKKTPEYVCRYDTVRLGFSEAGKKLAGPPPGAANGKQMPPRGRARGWRAAAAAKSKGEM